MNEDQSEKISALLDEELDLNGALTTLSGLRQDRELASKLHRYGAVSQYLKTGSTFIPDQGFVGRVSHSLESEPVVLAPRVIRHQIREKAATFALAASIAMLAVLVGRSVNVYSPMKASEMLASVDLDTPVVKASMEPDFRDYLTMHNESTYLSGAQGMLPSVRLVSSAAHR